MSANDPKQTSLVFGSPSCIHVLQDNLRRMMVMAVINFRQTCTKCGGSAERIITLHNFENSTDYEIYRCIDCKSLEWLPRSEQSEPVRD